MRTFRNDGRLLAFLLLVTASAGVFYLVVRPAVLHEPPLLNDGPGVCIPNLVTSAMIASGKGFVEPLEGNAAQAQYPEAPELTRFLRHETMHLSPGQIPGDLRTCKPRCDWDYRHRYLVYTIGALWRVFGISWHVVTALRIAMHCVMIGAIYGLMRLGMGRLCSAAITCFLAATPFILCMEINIRDFGKGPFVLVAMLLIGCLIKYPLRRAAFFGLAALLGLVIGVGTGFRADVLTCLLPALFALACCRRARGGIAAGERLAAAALLAVSFLAPASQIMGVYSGGNLFAHDIIMGLATRADDMLGTNRASYEKLYVNHDTLVAALAESFYERSLAPGETPQYTMDERPYLIRLACTFPGDLLTRGYSSVLWVARGGVPSVWFAAFMTLCAAAVLLIIAHRDSRMAWMTLILFMYFSGYLSLQPERRHAFHLFFIPFWILGFLVDKLVVVLKQEPVAAIGLRVIRAAAAPRQWWTPPVRGMLRFALPVILLLTVPLYAARAYQDTAVGKLLNAHTTADLMPVTVKPRPLKGWVLFECSARMPVRSGLKDLTQCLNTEYWVAEFAPSAQWRRIWLQYATANEYVPDDWFAHGLWVAPCGKDDSGNLKYFFPVVEKTDVTQRGWALFSGIAVPGEQAGDFRGLYKVRNSRDFPLFLNLTLPADQTAVRRHQTLYGESSAKFYADAARYWLDPMPLFRIPPVNGVFGENDLNRAIKEYQDGLAADPHNALIHLGLAVCLEPQTTDKDTALRAYLDALADDPGFYVTYHYIDALFKRRGDTAGRIALWKETAREHPENYLPLFHLALALEECHDVDGAINEYRKVMELNPSDAGTLADIGRLLADKNDLDSAITVYRRAVDLDPLNRRTAFDLNSLQERRKNP